MNLMKILKGILSDKSKDPITLESEFIKFDNSLQEKVKELTGIQKDIHGRTQFKNYSLEVDGNPNSYYIKIICKGKEYEPILSEMLFRDGLVVGHKYTGERLKLNGKEFPEALYLTSYANPETRLSFAIEDGKLVFQDSHWNSFSTDKITEFLPFVVEVIKKAEAVVKKPEIASQIVLFKENRETFETEKEELENRSRTIEQKYRKREEELYKNLNELLD
jgi:hypothetical protein